VACEDLAGLTQNASPLWDLLTGLVRQAKANWIALVTLPGEDRALDREGLERRLIHLQSDLVAEGGGRLYALLVEHFLIAWMAVNHSDIQLANAMRHGRTTRVLEYWQRQQERTQRNLLRATQSLVTLRRLRPTAVPANATERPIPGVG
jgi:hypothetical protein